MLCIFCIPVIYFVFDADFITKVPWRRLFYSTLGFRSMPFKTGCHDLSPDMTALSELTLKRSLTQAGNQQINAFLGPE